eukprot:g28149.t1
MLQTVARHGVERVAELAPQHLANIAWACAKVQLSEEDLYIPLARASWQKSFKPQEACNLLWACSLRPGLCHLNDGCWGACDGEDGGTAEQPVTIAAEPLQSTGPKGPGTILTAIAAAARKKMADFSATQLSAVLWAASKASLEEPELFQAASRWLQAETLVQERPHAATRAPDIRPCRRVTSALFGAFSEAHFGFQDFQSSFVQDWIPDMARRMLAPWVALACFFAMGYTFLAPPKAEIPVAALTAAMAPAAAQAMDMPEVGSTLKLEINRTPG